jgi:ribosomal protein L40E
MHIELSRLGLKIPLEQIEQVRTIKNRQLMVTIRDNTGFIQDLVFYSGKIDEIKHAIFKAKLGSKKPFNTQPKIVEPHILKEKIIIKEREIEILYCQHCSVKNNARSTYCTHCGAPLR